jgi:hypothetical protein
MEIAKGVSVLLKSGWKPRRTLKLILWDGEGKFFILKIIFKLSFRIWFIR